MHHPGDYEGPNLPWPEPMLGLEERNGKMYARFPVGKSFRDVRDPPGAKGRTTQAHDCQNDVWTFLQDALDLDSRDTTYYANLHSEDLHEQTFHRLRQKYSVCPPDVQPDIRVIGASEDEFIQGLQNSDLLKRVDACENRLLLQHITIFFPQTAGAHSLLVCFNKEQRTYDFFDPNGGISVGHGKSGFDRYVAISKLLAGKGWTYVGLAHGKDKWESLQASLEPAPDSKFCREAGMCKTRFIWSNGWPVVSTRGTSLVGQLLGSCKIYCKAQPRVMSWKNAWTIG